MKFLCLLRYVDDPARPLPRAQADALVEEHLALNAALQKEGKWAGGGALAPGRNARIVKVRDGKLLVTDGPFAETREELGGFYLLQAASLEEACQLAGRIPSVGDAWVEVRPLRELYDDLNPPSPAPPAAPTVRLQFEAPMTLAAFVARYTPETLGRIPAQWGKFASEVGLVTGRRGPSTFGICHAWREGAMDYGCAVEVSAGTQPPPGWRLLSLPTARYAIFAHDGHVSELGGVESRILREWLPASGHALARGFAGGVELLERYGPRFDPQAGRGDVEVWLPLEG